MKTTGFALVHRKLLIQWNIIELKVSFMDPSLQKQKIVKIQISSEPWTALSGVNASYKNQLKRLCPSSELRDLLAQH